MSKWRRDEKVLVGGLAVIAAVAVSFVVALIINVATSEEIGRDGPAPYSYSYCARMSYGPKGMTSCAEYKTGKEIRIAIHKRGIFWDYDTYIVGQ